MADVLVDVEVVLAGTRPGAVDAHAVEHLVRGSRAGGRTRGPIARAGRTRCRVVDVVEHVAGALLGRVGGVVAVEHGVGQAAGARTIGTVPYLSAIICARPQGSNMLGITIRSDPA